MVCVSTGHANVIPATPDLTVHSVSALKSAVATDTAQMELAIVDKDGLERLAKHQHASTIATITASVCQESAIAELGLQEMIVQFVHAHQTATSMVNVLTSHVNVMKDGLDSTAL